MANWSRSERVVRTVVYTIPASEPWGACWTEVDQAMEAALQDYSRRYGRHPADDAIRVHAGDGVITVVFEVPALVERLGGSGESS